MTAYSEAIEDQESNTPPEPQDGWFPFAPNLMQKRFLRVSGTYGYYYGGRASGKTTALLMAASHYFHIPGYTALFLTPYRNDDLIVAQTYAWWLDKGARWSQMHRTWVFPSGARLTIARLEPPDDWRRFQGFEFQYLGLDHMNAFAQGALDALYSRLRHADVRVPTRLRAT